MKATQKYLEHYAETECRQLKGFPSTFTQCLLIPIYKETPEAIEYFKEFAAQHPNTLLILIINRPDTDPDIEWAKLLLPLSNSVYWQSENQQLSLTSLQNQSSVLWVDRCIQGPPIPCDQGVGLARKIANDIACQLMINQKISSFWLYNSDADARLPENYFQVVTATQQADNRAVVIFPYRHISDDNEAISKATQLYELSLFYYVAGLLWAKSPYAYHTLGSILCLNAHHYAQVRGFPKRAGAEDFYLLNKMAKTGDIINLETPTIELLCRESDRVPFGTGPAVKRINERANIGSTPFYHPQLFHYLKSWLELIDSLCRLTNIADVNANLDAIDCPLLKKASVNLKLHKALIHSFQQGKNSNTRLRHINIWFDAFKTLKFIHFIRDNAHPMITFEQWRLIVKNEPFIQDLAILNLIK